MLWSRASDPALLPGFALSQRTATTSSLVAVRRGSIQPPRCISASVVVSQAFADARESNVCVRWRPPESRYLASHRPTFLGDLRSDPTPGSRASLERTHGRRLPRSTPATIGKDHDAMRQVRGGGSTLFASTYASMSAS